MVSKFCLGYLFLTLALKTSRAWELDPEFGTNETFRQPKFMKKVPVPPLPCGPGDESVCVPRTRCERDGGRITEKSCGQGLGECCAFTATCSAPTTIAEVTQHVTVLNSPTNIRDPCTFRVRRPRNVCQIKLQFKRFTSASADANGDCSTDSISFAGTNTVENGFTTCGTLTGQHMYLSYGSSDTIEIRPTFTRDRCGCGYSIVVTQIQCNNPRRVPDHCMQFFDGASGRVQSWDYPNQQQNSQRYTICVGGLTNPRMINWQRCEPENNQNPDETFLIAGPNPAGPVSCDRDWLQINGLDRQCTFPSGVTRTSFFPPFLLNVNFDGRETPRFPNFIPRELRNLETQMQCESVGMVGGIRPDLGGIISCSWIDDQGACMCRIASQPLQGLFGLPDSSNTGFCLEFNQT